MQMSRRRFLALSATFTVSACAGDDSATPATSVAVPDTESPSTEPPSTEPPTTPTPSTEPQVSLSEDPFVYGVGSGDPNDTSVVLWTRLGGDLPDEGLEVAWEFVGDSGASVGGVSPTSAEVGGSVHAIIDVDEPGSYTFSVGEWTSPSGRTAPIDPTATEVRIAAASCQHFETGHYAAHRDIAEWAPDLVLFLGDFIYEGDAQPADGTTRFRSHEGPEPMDLDTYRARYATYLADPHLQACRAAAPWIAIWDDHEVENNYAGSISQDNLDPVVFGERRAMAYQVWWENTPTRLDPPEGDAYAIYRGVDIGDLVRISVLDGRQFRSDQVSDATLEAGPPAEGWDDPERSMLGAEQEAWISERFTSSTAAWNCLAQQTILADTRIGEAILNYDQWDGYSPARDRLLANAPANFVTITGDIHLAGVAEVGPIGAPVGIEFVTTSVSSSANVDPTLAPALLAIPSIVDADLMSRGYTRHTVTPDAWTAEYRAVGDIGDPESPVSTWKTFRVDSGVAAVSAV
jgi:alkaline phosphatase D